jgi:hypothetical protein
MDLDAWPDCPVEGCKNKICLALHSDKCFPHTDGNEHVKRWKIDARNASSDFPHILAPSPSPIT